ncbi:hypothetical protein CBL_00025 [Carabus blaptoides fortunei]
MMFWTVTGHGIIATAATGQRKIRQSLVRAVLIRGIVELQWKRFHYRCERNVSPENMD